MNGDQFANNANPNGVTNTAKILEKKVKATERATLPLERSEKKLDTFPPGHTETSKSPNDI